MLTFCDSFDHYSTYSQKWNRHFTGESPQNVGRNSTKGLQTGSGQTRSINHAIGIDHSTMILGCAMVDNEGTANLGGMRDYTGGDVQVSWRLNGGKVQVYRGYIGSLLGESASGIYAVGAYHYWEMKVLFGNGTAGSVVVRRDGEVVLTINSVDTSQTGNTFANGIGLGELGGNTNQLLYFDDVYVCDDTDSGVAGAPNDDFLGDVNVYALLPNGNGDTTQWDGSDGNMVDNYLLADDNPSDEDTTYVMSGDVGDKDTYEFGSLTPTLGTVFGIQHCPRARKTTSGTRSIFPVSRLGTSELDGNEKFLSASYQYFLNTYDGDPDGNQWTISNINAMEAGPKVAS